MSILYAVWNFYCYAVGISVLAYVLLNFKKIKQLAKMRKELNAISKLNKK